MCLAQAPQRNDTGEVEQAALRARVMHSTTEPLRSPFPGHTLLFINQYKASSFLLDIGKQCRPTSDTAKCDAMSDRDLHCLLARPTENGRQVH